MYVLQAILIFIKLSSNRQLELIVGKGFEWREYLHVYFNAEDLNWWVIFIPS